MKLFNSTKPISSKTMLKYILPLNPYHIEKETVDDLPDTFALEFDRWIPC